MAQNNEPTRSQLLPFLALTLALLGTTSALPANGSGATKMVTARKDAKACDPAAELFAGNKNLLVKLAARRKTYELKLAKIEAAYEKKLKSLNSALERAPSQAKRKAITKEIDDLGHTHKNDVWFLGIDFNDVKDYKEAQRDARKEMKEAISDARRKAKEDARRKEFDRRWEEEQKRWNEEEKRKEQAEKRKRSADLRKLAKRSEENSPFGQALRDNLTSAWIDSLDNFDAVALMFGNPYREPRPNHAKDIAELVSKLAETMLILYDADSKAAPIIARAAGERGVGISGDPRKTKSSKSGQVVAIVNPYLRMRAFQAPHSAVMTPDSITGLGLRVNGEMKYILDPEKKWTPGLERFTDSLDNSDVNLGVRFGGIDVPSTLESTAEAVKELVKKYSSAKTPDVFDFGQYISKGEPKDFEILIEEAQVLAAGTSQMQAVPGGAVVFGGSRLAYNKLGDRISEQTYATIYALASHGVPIVTGGAGGFMEIANAAAYNAGGDSVGIPITGSFRLTSEPVVTHDLQTLTIESTGYETRIPLLLERRKLILLAPGGAGTMKELATTFVHFGAHPDTTQQIAFLCKDYYDSLFNWLRSGLFASEFARHLHVVDDPSDLAGPIQAIGDSEAGEDFGHLEAPKPRNDFSTYQQAFEPLEKEEKRSKKRDKWNQGQWTPSKSDRVPKSRSGKKWPSWAGGKPSDE